MTLPRVHYDELSRKVDAFFARVDSRHPGEVACASGCTDCCKPGLSITGVEALAIREALSAMDADRRQSLRERARRVATETDAAGSCAALDPSGLCAVYEARPLVCRSHGLPLRFAAEEASVTGTRRLPVLDACFRNFTERALSSIPADCVLDQQNLSTTLAAIDASFADATGRPRFARDDLAAVLAET